MLLQMYGIFEKNQRFFTKIFNFGSMSGFQGFKMTGFLKFFWKILRSEKKDTQTMKNKLDIFGV